MGRGRVGVGGSEAWCKIFERRREKAGIVQMRGGAKENRCVLSLSETERAMVKRRQCLWWWIVDQKRKQLFGQFEIYFFVSLVYRKFKFSLLNSTQKVYIYIYMCVCVCVCVCVYLGSISSLMQISLNIIDILCLHIFFWIRSNSRITFIVFGGNWFRYCP